MEALVPAIIEQKVTGQEAFAGFRMLVHRYGERAPGPGAELRLWVQPSADTIRQVPSWEWLRMHIDPARSRALVTAARVADSLERTVGLPGDEVERRLTQPARHRRLDRRRGAPARPRRPRRGVVRRLPRRARTSAGPCGAATSTTPSWRSSSSRGDRTAAGSSRCCSLAGLRRPRHGARMAPRTHLPAKVTAHLSRPPQDRVIRRRAAIDARPGGVRVSRCHVERRLGSRMQRRRPLGHRGRDWQPRRRRRRRPSDALASPGRLFVVQAVPGASYAVRSTASRSRRDVRDAAPCSAASTSAPATTTSRFEPDQGQAMTADVEVRAGASTDLVLHLPADPGGDPVVDVYRRLREARSRPTRPASCVAHTATVPPADVRVDGKVVFEDIANGEFADGRRARRAARRGAAARRARPATRSSDRSTSTCPAGTVTMVYAVGTPTNGSMNVITHQEPIADRRQCRAAARIDTGSAGLVRARRSRVRAADAVVPMRTAAAWPPRAGWSSRWRRAPARRGDRQRGDRAGGRPTTASRSLDGATGPAGRSSRRRATRSSVRLPSGTVGARPAGRTRADAACSTCPTTSPTAGWWRGGARLGDPFGSTLIAGHVDAVDQGLGAFAELLAVRPGQRVAAPVAPTSSRSSRSASLRLVPQGDAAPDGRHLLGRGAAPADPGHLRAAVRRRPRRLPEPRRRHGGPGRRRARQEPTVKPSSRAVPPGRPPRAARTAATRPARRPPHRLPTRLVERRACSRARSRRPSPRPAARPPTDAGRRRMVVAVLVGVGVVVLLVECVAIVRSLRSDDSDGSRLPAAAGPAAGAGRPAGAGHARASEVRADGSVRGEPVDPERRRHRRARRSRPRRRPARPTPVRATDGRSSAADGTVLADDLTRSAPSRAWSGSTDPTTLVRATYVLRGRRRRGAPRVPGRLRARVVSLDLDCPALTGPTVVVVDGAGRRRGPATSPAPTPGPTSTLLRPCGTPDGSRWRVRLPAGEPRRTG